MGCLGRPGKTFGELIHVGNQVLVDRAQTAGPGTLNIPTEKIYELGNYQSVATIRDVPDLTFTIESLDVSADIECMPLGPAFATTNTTAARWVMENRRRTSHLSLSAHALGRQRLAPR